MIYLKLFWITLLRLPFTTGAATEVTMALSSLTGSGQPGDTTKSPEEESSEFLDSLLVNYDGRIRPNFGKESVLVNISMQVASIGHIAESTMDYRVTVFLRQLWNDPRLRFSLFEHPVNVDVSLLKSLWVPDLFVVNEKSADFHSVTKDNKLLRISPNGDVLLSQRLSLTLACNMKLHRFPMDQQICKIQLESYAFTTRDIDFDWADGIAMTIEESVELPQFYIQKYWTSICTRMYSTGEYPCVEALIKLQRQTGYYIIQTYIPTLLIVCLSWISFWIDASASTARVALGITTVLTMTTQTSSAQESLPKVSYIKAIDIWMAVCLLFVFSALLEFSAVNYMARYNEKRRLRKLKKAEKQKKRQQESGIRQNGVRIHETYVFDDPSSTTVTTMCTPLSSHVRMSSGSVTKPTVNTNISSNKSKGIIGRLKFRRQNTDRSNLSSHSDIEQYVMSNNNLPPYGDTTVNPHTTHSENSLVNTNKQLVRDDTSDDEYQRSIPELIPTPPEETKFENAVVASQSDESKESDLSIRVDEFSRLAFPLAFILFNVFYWCTFMA
ncbi:glycine receptor subunit alpha-4-like isoform X2 [Convolutriloba macropyga]